MPSTVKTRCEHFIKSLFSPKALPIWICALIVFKVLATFLAAYRPLTSPHIWRQTDTLGVSLRYAINWHTYGVSFYTLLPSVLNSGDGFGIMPMEFPALNLFLAPIFYMFPLFEARILAFMAYYSLNFALLACNYKIWRPIKIGTLSAGIPILLLPLFSVSGTFWTKAIPDVPANLLALGGLGLLWQHRRPKLALLLLTLGLLMKPPVIAVCLLLLLKEEPFAATAKRYLPPIAIASFFVLCYYTFGLQWLETYQEGGIVFYTSLRPPLASLWNFFTSPLQLFSFLNYHPLFPFGFSLLVSIGLFLWCRGTSLSSFWRKWLLGSCTSLLLIAVLDGSHSFVHPYYFLGCSLLWCLGWAKLWESRAVPYFVRFLMVGIMLGHQASILSLDFKPYYASDSSYTKFKECENLRKRHPEFPWGKGVVFRANSEVYPSLGFCFGERQKSETSAYGFFVANDIEDSDCVSIEKSQSIELTRCL